jgi:two-component system osmolarity sensor histidine kinase EnvZ
VWVALLSPLEPVWLFAPMRSPQRWPLDPLLLGLALLGGSVSASLLFLWVEVQRPLQRLEQALSQVGLAARPAPLAAQGTGAVRRLTGRFNAMVQRLDQTERERETMLAGIAHDLKSPITRLRLRLGLARPDPADLQRSEADLDALERITAQFLLFAGGVDAEPPVEVPLEQLLAELSAAIDPCELQLDLEPMQRWVQPTALGRAVGNLLDNALSHGQVPLRLVLRPALPEGEGFRIAVWDCGAGIAPDQWAQALMPFQRLDRARGGLGHCGLGLAIAARVAAAHGGGLEAQRSEQGFAVVLQGRSLPAAAV